MQAIFQQPQDLVLATFAGVPQVPITILTQQTWGTGDWRVEFCIIGESHAVYLQHRGACVWSEVLLCYPIPPNLGMTQHSFASLQTHEYSTQQYCVAVAFDSPDWVIPELKPLNTLELTFPEMFGEIPMTRVQWQGTQDRLQWWTLHTYPLPTGTVRVFSTSTLNLTDMEGYIR